MKKLLLVAFGIFAIVGSANALDFSSVACPPGGVPGPRTDEYIIDDGLGENSIGLTAGGTIIWANSFQVLAGFEQISEIRVAWGQVAAGRTGTLLIFSDPNNDGNMNDVTSTNLLFSGPVTSEGNNTDDFFTYPTGNVCAGVANDWFFVGLCLHQFAGDYPSRIDQSSPVYQSFVGGDGGMTFDCTNVNSGNVLPMTHIDDLGFPGNWMVRASSNGICGETPAQNASWGNIKAMYR